MKEYNFLAFDIGATSGRAVLGTLKDAKFEMKEIHRFPNPMVELHGRFYWDIYHLYTSLIESLTVCARQRIRLHSIGIDTWGVDFGYVALDGSLLGLPRAYRDPYTDGAPEDFFKRIPKEEVYKRTGIQVMPFNSLFQLFRAGQDSFIPQEVAEKILFIPDLLAYMLTERMVCEYTIASTSQLLNPETHKFDYKLLEAVGVSPTLICPVVMPGTLIGRLSESIARKTGIGEIPVIAVAGHDTASAGGRGGGRCRPRLPGTGRAWPVAARAVMMRRSDIGRGYNGSSGRNLRGEQPRNRAISLIWLRLYLISYFGLSAMPIKLFDTPMPKASMACDTRWAMRSRRTASITYISTGVFMRRRFSIQN